MAEQLTTDALRQALADEFRAALEAVLENVLSTSEEAAPGGPGWTTPLTVTGDAHGQFAAWVDEAGVLAIAKAMTGLGTAPEPAAAAEMVRELWTQATSALPLRSGYASLTLDVGPATPGVLPDAASGIVMREGDLVLATLAIGGSLTQAAAAGVAEPAGGPGRSEYPGNLAALLDVDLPLVVRFARTEMSLRALAQLAPGSMVDMGRPPEAPVQLLIGSHVIAEGEVVVVAGNYGVRITSLVSPADRLRAMEL